MNDANNPTDISLRPEIDSPDSDAARDDVPDPDASPYGSDDWISQWFDDTESSLSSAHSGERRRR